MNFSRYGCLLKQIVAENISSTKNGGDCLCKDFCLGEIIFPSFGRDFFQTFLGRVVSSKIVLKNVLIFFGQIFLQVFFGRGVSSKKNCGRKCPLAKNMVGNVSAKMSFGRDFV